MRPPSIGAENIKVASEFALPPIAIKNPVKRKIEDYQVYNLPRKIEQGEISLKKLEDVHVYNLPNIIKQEVASGEVTVKQEADLKKRMVEEEVMTIGNVQVFKLKQEGDVEDLPEPIVVKEELEYKFHKEKPEVKEQRVHQKVICEICGKKFPNEQVHEMHLKKMHTDGQASSCGKCNKVLANIKSMWNHRRHCGAVHVCEHCGLKFGRKESLESHRRKHTKDYKYVCEDCGKGYYSASSYNQHVEVVHAGTRYTCEVCGSVLRSKRYYGEHMKLHDTKSLKKFQCDVCKKYYSSYGSRWIHMKMKHPEKVVAPARGRPKKKAAAPEQKVVCEVCGGKYHELVKHQRRVHELNMLPCTECDATFLSRPRLLKHMYTHDGIEKNFACQECEARFITLACLRQHTNEAHLNGAEEVLYAEEIGDAELEEVVFDDVIIEEFIVDDGNVFAV